MKIYTQDQDLNLLWIMVENYQKGLIDNINN